MFLGDGAAWIWNLAARHLPEATQIVDLYHAREHLHDLARLLEFMLGNHQQAWLGQRLADLDDGDIPAICAAARAFPSPAARPATWTPPWATSSTTPTGCATPTTGTLGMFTGSGAVEAGCKSIVAQRSRNLSGMRWTVPGATAS